MKITYEEHRTAKSGNTKKLVIMLHGIGSNAADLISLVDYLGVNNNTSYISPNAPTPYDMASVGFQWFSLKDYSEEALYRELTKAAPIFEKYLEEQIKKYSIDYNDVIVLGFSQGTMMALHSVPRLPHSIDSVIAISGALINSSALGEQDIWKPSILLIHGDADQVVPFAAFKHAANDLISLGFQVDGFVMNNTGHNINSAALNKIKDFLISRGCS